MITKDSTKARLMIGWLGLAAAYIFLVLPRLGKPMLGWEALVWDIPYQIATHGYSAVRYFYIPPLYDSFIALSFRIFSISEFSARIPGICCFLFMPAAIYFLTKAISASRDRLPVFFIACAMFITAPIVIQGSLLIDRSDTTLLMLALTLFYLCIFKMEDRFSVPAMLSASGLYALCLWTKVTTPLACLVSIPLAYMICGKIRKGLFVSLGIFSIGAVFFAVTWGAFCYFIAGMGRFFEPFAYYKASASGTLLGARSGALIRIVLDLFRIYLWLSPFLLILSILAAWKLFAGNLKREAHVKEMQLAIFAGVVFAGYLYANATFSGFPKYIVPALPMVCCIAANFIWRTIQGISGRKAFFGGVILAGAASIYYIFIVKDWVYTTFLLRQAQVTGLVSNAFQGLAFQQTLYLICPIALFLLSYSLFTASFFRRAVIICFAALIASNVALDIIQRQAAYSVNFAYGTEGAERLRSFLMLTQPANALSSIEGYVANVGRVGFGGINADVWDDPRKLLKLLTGYKPECLIYGLAVNTATQLRNTMADPLVKAFLDNNYESHVMGSYTVLTVRKRPM